MTQAEIGVLRPKLPSVKEVAPYLAQIDARQQYSNGGPLVRSIEERYASVLGVSKDRVVAASSGTLCIEGAAQVLLADTWIVPGWTFTASVLPLLRCGARVLAKDVNPMTWALDPQPRSSSGVLHVVPFGMSPRLTEQDPANTVLIDAAASLGNEPDLSQLPPRWAVVFSLHATKILGCGEGGLAVFGSPQNAEAFREWINFGFSDLRRSEILGTNAKMSEMSAAYAHAALDRWPCDKEAWRVNHQLKERYSRRIGLDLGPLDVPHISPYWIANFSRDDLEAERVSVQLGRLGIESKRWWPFALTDHPAVGEHPSFLAEGELNVCVSLARKVLGLPMGLHMTRRDFGKVSRSLRGVVRLSGASRSWFPKDGLSSR